MQYFSDFAVMCALFSCGFFVGYYLKFVYVYDNLWSLSYSISGILIVLGLSWIYGWIKKRNRQYRFDQFYAIFYGLICFVISSCFMITQNMEVSFYFSFIGLAIAYVPSYGYLNLHCSCSSTVSQRPSHIALANACYFAGLTAGFELFNEFESRICGLIALGVCLLTLALLIINEVLYHLKISNYKRSLDLVFNLLNDEKQVFASAAEVRKTFQGRPDIEFSASRQWLVVYLAFFAVLERSFLYSPSFLQLSWRSTVGILGFQPLYLAYLLYCCACIVGSLLLRRYQPKFVYLMFALIKITALAALLGIYEDDLVENCFIFICFYYVAMGVYSSICLQLLVECTPLLYTEVAVSISLALELLAMELMKLEMKIDNFWHNLLGMGCAILVVTAVSALLLQFFMPPSEGLIEMRNRLLGIRKSPASNATSNLWISNQFLQHNIKPENTTAVKLCGGKRVFQQYPAQLSEVDAQARADH